jgi:hypothetical protein
MAIIFSYPTISASDLHASDRFILSQMNQTGNPTKSVTLSDLANFITTTGEGTGTTDYIVKWNDGPNGILGDSPAFTFDGGAGLKQFILTDGYRFVVDRDAATTVGDPEYAITQNGVSKTSFGWDDDGGGFGFLYNWAGKGFKFGSTVLYPQLELLTDPDIKTVSFADFEIQDSELTITNAGGGSTMLQVFNGAVESSTTNSTGGGTATQIVNRNNDLYIKNRAELKDILFQADDGQNDGNVATYFRLDGSMADVGTPSYYTRWGDNSHIVLGNSTNINSLDFHMYHDSNDTFMQSDNGSINIESKGGLFIKNEDASEIEIHNDLNSDLTLRSEGDVRLIGSGFNQYFRVDSGLGFSVASKDIRFSDNVKAKFGDSDDLQIYHDGANSIIEDVGTGDLDISGALAVNITGGGVLTASFSPAGFVATFGGTNKISTSSTGIDLAQDGDGIKLRSPNGTVYLLTVDNAGNLVVT